MYLYVFGVAFIIPCSIKYYSVMIARISFHLYSRSISSNTNPYFLNKADYISGVVNPGSEHTMTARTQKIRIGKGMNIRPKMIEGSVPVY